MLAVFAPLRGHGGILPLCSASMSSDDCRTRYGVLLCINVTTSEAIKALRKTLAESQQAFAGRLGLYISSVAHYEGGDRSPDYLVTLKLYRAACDADRKDLAAYFLGLINAGIVPRVAVPFRNESERESIQALQAILYDARFEHLRQPLEEVLAPVKAHLSRIAKRKQKEVTK
jgi:transcriptional regulator with XRE-family HTH domain